MQLEISDTQNSCVGRPMTRHETRINHLLGKESVPTRDTVWYEELLGSWLSGLGTAEELSAAW